MVLAAIPISWQAYLGKPDARVEKWFLFMSPLILGAVLSSYWLILIVLRRFMRDRKAFDLRNLLILYNACQVLYSMFICKEVFVSAYKADYTLACTPLNKGGEKLALRMAHSFWYFYLSKICDLFDTVFFILRKKNSQLSFLHVYHHSSMVFNWYLGTLYLPGGQSFFSVMVNSFVHVIMYTYYMLTAMGPKAQKYLWWKKYLTQIQMIQFMIIMVHILVGFYNQCKAPYWLTWFTVTYLWSLLILFGQFYYMSYRKKIILKGIVENDIRGGGDYKMD